MLVCSEISDEMGGGGGGGGVICCGNPENVLSSVQSFLDQCNMVGLSC